MSSTEIGMPVNKTNIIKRQIIFEENKEVSKKMKNMNLSDNMDIDEEE